MYRMERARGKERKRVTETERKMKRDYLRRDLYWRESIAWRWAKTINKITILSMAKTLDKTTRWAVAGSVSASYQPPTKIQRVKYTNITKHYYISSSKKIDTICLYLYYWLLISNHDENQRLAWYSDYS